MQHENAATVIGESILVMGQLSGDEDMTVLGRVEGSIDLTSTLFVANDGIVKADVTVGNAVISGIVIGNVTAHESVQITETGRLVGDLRAPRVVITAGARVRGQVDMGGEANDQDRQELSTHKTSQLPAHHQHQSAQSASAATTAALVRAPSGRFQRLSLPQRRPIPQASSTLRRPDAREAEPAPQREHAARTSHSARSSHKAQGAHTSKKTGTTRSRRAAGRRRD